MNLTPDVDKFIPYSTLEWMDRCQMWIHGTYLYLTVRMGTCSYEYSYRCRLKIECTVFDEAH